MGADFLYFPNDTIPGNGDDMKITDMVRDKATGLKRYRVDHAVRIGGKATHIRRVAIGSTDLALKIAEIKQQSGSGSLKSIEFAKCVDNATRQNNGASMMHIYNRIKTELGRYRVDRSFALRYNDFISSLQDAGLSVNTVANYKGCIRHALKKAWTDRLIDDIPVRDFGIRHTFRSRIWSQDERLRILAQLDCDDNLYWIILFSEVNPIRKMDLVGLTRENLVLVGPHAPYIRFQPEKTKNSKPKPCILANLSDGMLARFAEIEKRFPDCPYLFPAIYKNQRDKAERWEYQGNFKKMFATVCKNANVSDFHFHDIKHVAISYMLSEQGYSRDVLKKRGIQMSDKAIDVYDQSDALDTLGDGNCSIFVAPIAQEAACAS